MVYLLLTTSDKINMKVLRLNKRVLPWIDESLSWEENIVALIFGSGKFWDFHLSEMGKVYIHGAVNALPLDERAVMVKYYKDRLQQSEIANYLEISSDEVDILCAKAIRKLRHPLCSRELREYISKHFHVSRNANRLVSDLKFHKNDVPRLKKSVKS